MNDTAPNVIVIPAKVETPQEQEKRRHLRVAAYCRCGSCRRCPDRLRRFLRKHCRFCSRFRCRFCRFRQHHQGGRYGSPDR